MVLISSKKYACETCIKGHRSSACKHTDRPLFEIKKKGRPVTQCEHCRELRKTKQVHVKCICEAKEPPSPKDPTKKKGTPTLPAHAAFPNGVPDAGSATTSDSDHGGSNSKSASASASSCSCKVAGGACHCCTPRTRPAVRRRSEPPPPTSLGALTTSSPSPTLPIPSPSTSNIHVNPPSSNTSPVLPATPHPTPNPSPNPNPVHSNATAIASTPALPARAPSHHILARLAELRPVLPRLSARDAALMQGAAGQHDLFHHSPGHGHHPHPGHAEHFSPYGRAYEHAFVDYSSDASTSSAGFYQQDARSVESLLSISSLASVASHGHAHRSQKSHSQKSHSQKSPSYDGGKPNATAFLRGAEVEWRLPPSLSRSNPGEMYPTSPSYDAANPNGSESAALAPRPRSEGGSDVYSMGNTSSSPNNASNTVFAPRPRSEAAVPPSSQALAAGYPRPRSEGGGILNSGGVRTCGCGAGCACAGCALHGVPLPSSRSGASASKNRSGGNTNGARHCADPVQCGGACLDCTILTLPDFSVGFGANNSDKPYRTELEFGDNAGYRGNGNSKAYRAELDLDLGDVDPGYARDLGELYELPPDGYDLGLELGADIDVDVDVKMREDLDAMGAEMDRDVLDALEQQRQSAAIDEWIREVGALPLPAPGATPFEFEHALELEGVDGGASTTANAAGGGASAGGAPVKMEFDDMMEFDLGQSWMFHGAGDVGMPPPSMQGLSSADVRPATEFLSVPGPVAGAHGRSRSSSSASSEASVSMLGVGGVGAGPSPHDVGPRGVGVVGVGLAGVPALDLPPLARKAPSVMLEQFSPVYMDDQMLFFAPPSPSSLRPHPHTQ
ncbi:ACE1 transcriptional factor [Mycena sanguinolenta]|uniref:ACE1 transcriptional factor n=1 Tax=Mycena sanguinolenta TaxID=230812 RepID=A0A8H6YXU6_9AGAR|nr:ACE1 transcriptional factor [Mycena sanguinolenta]